MRLRRWFPRMARSPRLIRTTITTLLIGVAIACAGQTHRDAPTRALLSGQQIRVLYQGADLGHDGIQRFTFNYCTNVELKHDEPLYREVDSVWATIQKEVQSSGATRAYIDPTACTSEIRFGWHWPPIIRLFDHGTGFIFVKGDRNQWHRVG